jgi:CheY-like chemotaxis protein
MELQQLLELTSRLSEPLRSDEVVRVVVDHAAAANGATWVLMWSVDDPPTHATVVRAKGLGPDAEAGYPRIALEPCLPMGDAILRREALFFASQDHSYTFLPLVVHGRAIGGLSIVFPGGHAFEADERVLLTVLAHHAAQALERARLFERANVRSSDLAVPEQCSGARRRVLLVDDNRDASELLEDALTEMGHEVRTAADGSSALQLVLVQAFTPDIAFLDIGLPVMDGCELARELRGIPSLENTPLVAITAYTGDADRRRAFASGFTEYLAKPLAFERVIGCIERLTSHRP